MEKEENLDDNIQILNNEKYGVPSTTVPPGGNLCSNGSGNNTITKGSDKRSDVPVSLLSQPSALSQPSSDVSISTANQTDLVLPQDAQGTTVTPNVTVLPSTDAVVRKQTSHLSSDVSTSTASQPSSLGNEAKVVENLDELVGMGDNVIVERSPGGRYVRFMEKLGSGASKDVYRAYDTQEGIEVAWNVVNLVGIPKTDRNRIVNEVRLLEQLHHQNIISFHGSWVNRERQEVIFVTEILSSGTLKSFIKKVQVIRWKIAKRWAIQILNGLDYLHLRDPPVIHRDLKCENIFINGASGDLRIGDFGLSTLYRNGKVRSVLGTPEFMAPDMYEETSYDEKVDIYAFGMCLLEIFTKEIPYAECSNPAQIYKKVSAGEPPEVLSRLKSRHARKFVELCLGYKDETTGKYIRPAATELLKHPFLLKRLSDDNEVEVEPSLRERGIVEEGESQTMSPPVSAGTSQAQNDSSAIPSAPRNDKSRPASGFVAVTEGGSNVGTKSRALSEESFDDDECDRFEQMPESEVNIRNVKVFMGRGQELKEDENVFVSDSRSFRQEEIAKPDPSAGQLAAASSTTSPLTTSSASLASNITDMGTNGLSPNVPQFPIVAGVAAPPNGSSQASDIRQFVVTLPLDGQTQNVQFDFHLVDDDPVQVAIEMVTELGLPQDAAGGISAIISSLASEARNARNNNQPMLHNYQHAENLQFGNVAQSQAGMAQSRQTSLQTIGQPVDGCSTIPEPHPALVSLLPQVLLQPRNSSNAEYGASVPLAVSDLHRLPMNPPHLLEQASMSFQTVEGHPGSHQPAAQFPFSSSSVPDFQSHIPGTFYPQTPQQNPAVTPSVVTQAAIPLQAAQVQPNSVPPVAHGSMQDIAPPLALANHLQNLQLTTTAPVAGPRLPVHVPIPSQTIQVQTTLPGSEITGSTNASAFQSTISSNVPNVAIVGVPAVGTTPVLPAKPLCHHRSQLVPIGTGVPMFHSIPYGNSGPASAGLMAPAVQSSSSISDMIQGHSRNLATITAPVVQPTKPIVRTSAVIQPSQTLTAPYVHVTPATANDGMQRTPFTALMSASQCSQEDAWCPNVADDDGDILSEDESSIVNELRKLDEDFKKNMLRSKKVFDSRMDNLQRTLSEREAQHQKTLEKHEKDRAAFERRVQQEELEHNRRIEQLQREWDEKREMLARQKQLGGLRSRKPSSDGLSLSPASGGARSHSTSPIHNPDILNSTTASVTTRHPLPDNAALPNLD